MPLEQLSTKSLFPQPHPTTSSPPLPQSLKTVLMIFPTDPIQVHFISDYSKPKNRHEKKRKKTVATFRHNLTGPVIQPPAQRTRDLALEHMNGFYGLVDVVVAKCTTECVVGREGAE